MQTYELLADLQVTYHKKHAHTLLGLTGNSYLVFTKLIFNFAAFLRER
jgi:hypothetical protein